jgi:hypothetical protein
MSNNKEARKLAKNIIRGKNTRMDTLRYPMPVIKGAYNKLQIMRFESGENLQKQPNSKIPFQTFLRRRCS